MTRQRVRLDEQGRPIEQPPTSAAPSGPVDCRCPRLETDDWHEVESDWDGIQFVRTHTTAVFGVPVGLAGLRADLEAKAAAAGAIVPEDAMLLFGEGRFRRPVMLEVEGAPPGARDVVEPGGIAFTRLVPAPFGKVAKLADETRALARSRYGKPPADLWLWYVTCRECSGERDFETVFVAHYPDGHD